MQLYRLLPNKAKRGVDLDLGCTECSLPLTPIAAVHQHGGKQCHAARLLEGNMHVGCSMLKRLKASDRPTKLVASLQIGDSIFQHCFHDTDRLRAHGGYR